MSQKPKTVMFDLGGVIVPWVGIEALAELNNITRDEVAARFAASEVSRAFERGLVDKAVFLTELKRIFDLPETDIAALWNSWVLPPFPGTLEALAELNTRFRTACLSNTNALHWARLNSMFDPDEAFHHAFASHLLNEAKPDAACYLKAIEIMGCAAEDIWFFDDSEANVEAARGVGMSAFHVNRSVGVLPMLRDIGLLPIS